MQNCSSQPSHLHGNKHEKKRDLYQERFCNLYVFYQRKNSSLIKSDYLHEEKIAKTKDITEKVKKIKVKRLAYL